MEDASVIGTLLLIVTGIITYKGFRDEAFFERYLFEVDPILIDGERDRLISSGFLHSGWFHFGFNMIALLSFTYSMEMIYGFWKLLLMYFASMLGGSLLALYIHRNHGDYRAVGASGAISGIIFSSIILFPDSEISFVILPVSLSSWLFGLLFVLVSIFGIKNQSGNIGHEAHLGGALTGIVLTLFLDPVASWENRWIVLLLLAPTLAFLSLVIRNPAVLLIRNYWGEHLRDFFESPPVTREDKEAELDRLLAKIKRTGFDGLSSQEKRRLQELRDEL
jgi:membrane associated rhomboid family serine protease